MKISNGVKKISAVFLCATFLLVGLGQQVLAQNTIPTIKVGGVPVPNPFPITGPAGQSTALTFIFTIINILLLIVGTISVLFLIIGGFRYVTAAGNEERSEAAKKTIQHAILGIVIVILSFVIIRVITSALILNTP